MMATSHGFRPPAMLATVGAVDLRRLLKVLLTLMELKIAATTRLGSDHDTDVAEVPLGWTDQEGSDSWSVRQRAGRPLRPHRRCPASPRRPSRAFLNYRFEPLVDPDCKMGATGTCL
ncbi:hypothetical protein DT019_38560 [Streptomyces sp. SDr-06]|nr:hypothetical protein DT019_38560 [Streptomyces sp. SDr-06]